MKAHTSDYKDKIKEFGKQITSKITYELEGETIELGKEELNSVTPHYEGAILKSIMRQLDIDSNVDIALGTILNYKFGLFVNRYTETSDETYQADIDYYELEDGEYVLLVAGTDYTVGDNITGTIYNYQDYEYLDFGNYIVYSSEKQEDTNSYKIICYDKMLYSMVDYTTPQPNGVSITYPISIRDYINAICTHLGLTFKNANSQFANWNKQITKELYLDNGGNSLNYKFRDVLDELAQVTASTICINETDDELEIRYITDTYDTIDEEYLKDVNVNFGELCGPYNTIVLSRSADSDKIYKSYPEDLPEEDRIAIEIKDNQIMNWNDRSDYLPDILAKLDGLQYYLNDYTSPGITYYNLCDRYNVSIGENTYSCVMFNDELDITQGLQELVHTDMPEETETDYSKADKTDRKINQTYLIVDKQNQQISSVISNVDEQNNKISQITQTVDELNTKIQDVADITKAAESVEGNITLEGINASEPIMIKIHPQTQQERIAYGYPYGTNYPEVYMQGRKIRFENTTKYELTPDKLYDISKKYFQYDSVNDEYVEITPVPGYPVSANIYQYKTIEYEIPDDLFYYDEDNYDEFYLDYDSQTCQVTKKCTLNSTNHVVKLNSEIVTSYPYPTIQLDDGDYNVKVPYIGWVNVGYLYVRLMASNIYTSQFATRVEMTSAINQKADEISLVVNEKLDQDDFTHASIVLKINDDTSQAQIHADKVDIDGTDVINLLAGNTINLTSKNIAIDSTKFKVTKEGNLTCSNANISGTITSSDATITGGNINMVSNSSNPKLTITGVGTAGTSTTQIKADGLKISRDNFTYLSTYNSVLYDGPGNYKSMNLELNCENGNYVHIGGTGSIENLNAHIDGNGSIDCKAFYIINNGSIQAKITSEGNIDCRNLLVRETKARIVEIDNGTIVGLNAYETATPYFGDIGSNKTDSNGYCRIDIENIFSQTIEKEDYKVFIQECGEGNLYVIKKENYFEVKGTPNLDFDWELKAIQKGYKGVRLKEYKERESDK